MLRRFAPLLGTFLIARVGRKVGGRYAGTLALAFGAFELFRAYQRNKANNATAHQGTASSKPASRSDRPSRPSHRRRRSGQY